MKVLFVLTSHNQLGYTNIKTGFWLEELVAPYYKLSDQGVEITLASPNGGLAPIDPQSEASQNQTISTQLYYQDINLQQKLSHTLRLSDVKSDDYDAIFFVGGHGPLFDLTFDPISINLIQDFYTQNKPIAAVCHAPAALLEVKDEKGNPLIKGKRVTGFSNSEEAAFQLTKIVPYLVEDKLKEFGGIYSKAYDWQPYVVQDGLLLTGQNPASAGPLAEALLQNLQIRAKISEDKHKTSGKIKSASVKVGNFLYSRFKGFQEHF